MRTIRASEIGTYLFCARAWWHQRNGSPSLNEKIMKEGTEYHEKHGETIATAGLFQRVGLVLLLGALIVAAVALTSIILQ